MYALSALQIYEVIQACMKAMPHITSTKDLPPEIPEMPSDTRSKVIHELYTTEYTYVHSLETLSEVHVYKWVWSDAGWVGLINSQ